MTELADQLSTEAATGLESAEIPQGVATEEASSRSEAQAEKPLSLRDQINKSVESVRTEEAKRERDAAGKFAKTDKSAEGIPTAKPEIPKTEQNAPAVESKTDSPPSAWVKIWDGLTPEARAIAVKREAEVAKGFEDYRGKTAQLQEISQALDPIRPVLQQNGIQSDAQAVKQLLQWEGSFRNPATRVQAFHQLAQQYGVDLNSLVQNPSQAQQEIPDPLRPVIDQFGNIVQRFDSLEARLQRQDQERVSSELNVFASKPEHAHFEKVKVTMGQLMSAGIAQDLESAYQKAIQIVPEVASAIEAEKTAKAQAELAKTNAEKAARARQAAVSPSVRSPNGAPTRDPAKAKGSNVRDSILNSVAELREGQRT